jgi:uncharacterized protein YbaR (Trm112 family)
MPADSSQHFAFDPTVLDRLACPACLGDLRLEEAQLVCAACGHSYPIVDGIPVLIAAREENGQSEGGSKESPIKSKF